jgi:putative ABC transport system permease protein
MFGVVLGVAVILAINITNLSTLDSIVSVFTEASGKANLVITSATNDGQGFSDDALRRVSNIPGVKAAVPSLQTQAALAAEAPASELGIDFFGMAAGGLIVYGIDPSVDTQSREYKLVAGQFLGTDLSARDALLVKDYATEKHLGVGSALDILTSGGVERLRVVGLIAKQGPGQVNNGAFAAMPLKAAQEIFNRGGNLDQIDIVAAPGYVNPDALDQLKEALAARLGRAYTVGYPASQSRRVTQMLDAYQIGLSFFSVIALFVGAFLVYNAFSMTVVERTREIGMLRTLGMTRGQVMQQILIEASIVAVVGCALGVGAGVLLAEGLIRATELMLGQEVHELRVPLDGLLSGVIVGLGVTLAAAAIPAWQASRVSPLEALRARSSSGEGWIVRRGWALGLALLALSYVMLFHNPFPVAVRYRMGSMAVFTLFVGATLMIPITAGAWERAMRPLVRRLYGAEGQLGSSNIQRARMRTMLTVGALMVGVAMVLGIRGMTDAFEHDISTWIESYIGGDAFVHSTVAMNADLGPRLAAVDGVAAITPIRYFDVKHLKPDGTEESLTFTAVDPEQYTRVTSFVFASNQGDENALIQDLAGGDSILLSSVLAEKYGIKQGDSFRLQTRRGQRDFQVAAIYVDFNYRGLVMTGSWKDMRRYFQINDVTAYLLKVAPGYAPEDVKTTIDSLYGLRRHLTIELNRTLKARASQLMAQAFSLFDVLALIAVIVAALGVVNTLTMNVLERTREIGMLRSLGMTRWQVGKMILAEAMLMGLIGGVFGMLFGLLLSRLFLIAVTAMQGYELSYVLPTQGIVIGLLIAIIVSHLAAIWPAQRAASIRIIEAMQYE